MDSPILLVLLLLPLASGVAIPLLPPTLARPAALVMAGAQLAMGLLIALGERIFRRL